MLAQSLVVGARTLDRRADALLAEPRLADTGVLGHGLAQLATLCTVDALVAAGTPLPVPDAPVGVSTDRTVRVLLDRLYDDGPLDRAALDDRLVERATDTDRVAEAGTFLLVPLTDRERHVHNWRPVFRLLVERLDDVASKCERVVARVEAESLDAVTQRTWRSTVESLEETQSALKIQLARQERLQRLYARPADEPAEFAAWTIDRLTDVRSEP